jgi:hypothetical protein
MARGDYRTKESGANVHEGDSKPAPLKRHKGAAPGFRAARDTQSKRLDRLDCMSARDDWKRRNPEASFRLSILKKERTRGLLLQAAARADAESREGSLLR